MSHPSSLGPHHVGQRVVVRYLLAQPEPGAVATDVLGELLACDAGELVVATEGGERVRIPAPAVIAGRPVPPRGSTLLRIGAERLEVVAAQGWPARTVERVGDWWLREAGGFTGRANSLLPVGDPGRTLAEALSVVEAFYRRYGLPTLAQAIVGSPAEEGLLASGWDVARHRAGVLVQVASVTQARRRSGGGTGAVALLERPTPGWMDVYGRAEGVPADLVMAVVAGPDDSHDVVLAAIRDGSSDQMAAIGRGVLTSDWLGLSAVEVVPSHRGQGLARRVVDALLEWGAERGARSAYLQTLPDNAGALALYAPYGFVTHHRYRYLSPAPDARPRRVQDPGHAR